MRLKLEVFKAEEGNGSSSTVVLDTMALEEAKLASYDSGYSAGWEDAAAAQADDQTKIGADLARNLQSLSFTYQEARLHVLRAIEPLMQEMVSRLLPVLARETLAPVVLEILMPLAEQMVDAPVSIVLNPASRGPVEELVAKISSLPIALVEEPSLGEGQVYLRLGAVETQIDLDRATAEIATAVRGFFEIPDRERQNG